VAAGDEARKIRRSLQPFACDAAHAADRLSQVDLRSREKPSQIPSEPIAKDPRTRNDTSYPAHWATQPPKTGLNDAPTPWAAITAPWPRLTRPRAVQEMRDQSRHRNTLQSRPDPIEHLYGEDSPTLYHARGDETAHGKGTRTKSIVRPKRPGLRQPHRNQ
jgi:hypothetical protein